MLNQPLDAAIRRGLIGDGRLVVERDVDWPGRQVLDCGLDDIQRFTHFIHADEVAREAVASLCADDLKRTLQFRISQVRLVLAEIADDAGSAGHRTAATRIDGVRFRKYSDAAGAIDE